MTLTAERRRQAVTTTDAALATAGRMSPTAAAGLGFGAAVIVVLAAGRVGPAIGSTSPTSWLGLLSRQRVDPNVMWWPGLMLLVGMLALAAAWLIFLAGIVRHHWTRRQIWWTAALWATPFAIGPPILSSDVYSYVAQGNLAIHQGGPYGLSPVALGPSNLLAAIDPNWVHAKSPYGPVATLLEAWSVRLGFGNPVAAVVVFRLIMIACWIAIGLLCAELAQLHARVALGLTLLNPLLLTQGIGAMHIDVPMCVLILAALVAVRRDHPFVGIALGCVAAAMKIPAVVVPIAIGVALVAESNIGWPRVQAAFASLAVAAATWLGLGLITPDGWGWLRDIATPAAASTPIAPAAITAAILHLGLGWSLGSPAILAIVGATIAALVGLGVVIHLLSTSSSRVLPRTAANCLYTVAVFGPVLHPWYLLWGVVCQAAEVNRRQAGVLVAVSLGASFYALPGLVHWLNHPSLAAVGVCCVLIVALAAVAPAPLRTRHAFG